MRSLGLEPTPNSGSGWVVKEDGQSESIICQLKSTDRESIGIKKLDLDKLVRNAVVAHKTPVFAIQFIQSGDIYLMMRPEDVGDIASHLLESFPEARGGPPELPEEKDEEIPIQPRRIISGASKSRDRFHAEQAKRWDKIKKAK